MSEYTNYCLVRSEVGVGEILRRLRERGICAVVDDSSHSRWVVVAAPGESGFALPEHTYYYAPAFPSLASLFDVVLELWEDEGPRPRWTLNVGSGGSTVEIRSDAAPDEAALTLAAKAAEIAPERLRGLLHAGRLSELCEAIGAPYLQMTAQKRTSREALLSQGGAVHCDDLID